MAAFSGSALNTLDLADTINQFASKTFISTIRKESALINMATGAPSDNGKGEMAFAKSEVVTGRNVEIPLVISARTPVGVVDGFATESATITPTSPSGFGAVEAPIAHYTDPITIEYSRLVRIGGDQEKMENWLNDLMQQVTDSYAEKYAADLNRVATGSTLALNGAPSTGALGSWVHAISDGVSTGETNYALFYGGFDRSDAANAPVRAPTRVASGTLTLGKLFDLQTAIKVNRGKPTLAIMGATLYAAAHALVEGKTQVISNSSLTEFASFNFAYAGIEYALEAQCPSGTIGLLDPRTWFMRQNKSPLVAGDLVRHPNLASMKIMFTDQFMGLFCKAPWQNGKITGSTP